MIVKKFTTGPIDTNSYLLICPSSKSAVVIDVGQDSAQELNSYAERHQLKLEKILLTHSHWDHIAGLAHLKNHLDIRVYVHQDDENNIINPGSDGLLLFIPIQGVKVDHYLKDEEVINAGDLRIKVIHTPGHTPGGVCFYLEEQKMLFSGDTLFQGAIGRMDLPTACSPLKMIESLKKLETLPQETIIYPGHGEKTTIKQELSNIHAMEKLLHKRKI
ncbi:MAG: MBL fold metallo-hydrolase [Candidatus Rhabdochlamydia sp.]|jgi:glyoxylase-like metal-dependent hydrolase (beta-lactamase superfamily II)|nr:hydroxyacylglutathione hydrolase [Chlamydiota bacterium]